MKPAICWTVIVFLSPLFICNVAVAEDGWGLSSLNPFGGTKSNTSNVSTKKDSSWLPKLSMPKMPWSKPSKAAAFQPKKQSAWTTFTNSSKSMWNKSTSWLRPSDKAQVPAFQSNYEKANKKPGFFQSWLYPPEEKKLETMSDFLSLPHPY